MTAPSPLALSPTDLADLTRHHAELFRAGAYPHVAFTPGHRWHRRIVRDARADVWLITWLPSQATELHDHGESQGAFTVVTGSLTELAPRRTVGGWRLNGTVRTAGASVHFGSDHVHDVVNRHAEPAVSVHAYSPPLTLMRYYRYAPDGLSVDRVVSTDDPEAA